MLDEGPTNNINGKISTAEQKFSITFSKAKTNFSQSLHCNSDNSSLNENGKNLSKFKAANKNINFPVPFFLGSKSKKSDKSESKEVSFKGKCMIFQSVMVLLVSLKF